ncbi:MAG TPA: TonB-dependent receptor [Rhodanobacter sp.]|nr:TonB-dependent receptor [Rhodanobacter sp.]
MKERRLSFCVASAIVGVSLGVRAAQAEDAVGGTRGIETQVTTLGAVRVNGVAGGYATAAHYGSKHATLGPLGARAISDAPLSVTIVPEDLIVNQQSKTVNDVLRSLPSVQIRDQQGLEVSRPQSRGFQGTVVQNTRLDGLNVIGTTAIPAENLTGIQVLNGMAGPLYGPETPAGVFNYLLKRPTAEPLLRLIESFDSHSIFTTQVDAGGMLGDNHAFGYRINLVHGQGESYVDGSNSNRNLISGAFDYHLGPDTVLEIDASHYRTRIDGLPGSIVYDSGASTILPRAINPTKRGVLGQPGAGTDLMTNTGLVKIKHDFGNGWNFEVGGLYQNAIRNLFGITSTFTDNDGNYKVTKNFTAIPHYTIASNLAQLNGHFDTSGLRNDFSVGTNGYNNVQYTYRNSIATPLGSARLAQPVIFQAPPIPDNGGQYRAGKLVEQSVIVGDALHLDEQWTVQGVFNTSWLKSRSYTAAGASKSADAHNGVVSPTVSLIYAPSSVLTIYATWSKSVEQGEAGPAGTVNANEFLAPYHDKQYEIGAKYAVSNGLLVTLDAFRMTRPLAITDAVTNVFGVVGTQRNVGAELFAQGAITRQLSLFGGITCVDAKLVGTGVAATNDKQVVGVPRVKTDVSLDYHPDFARGFALTGTLHGESRRASTNTNASFAPSYTTLDIGARYSTPLGSHFLTLRLQVINATDKYYYSSIADGNIVGSPGANTAYFAAPRTYLASVELDM